MFGFDYLDSQGSEFATYEEEINIEALSGFVVTAFDPDSVKPEMEPVTNTCGGSPLICHKRNQP